MYTIRFKSFIVHNRET